MQIPANLKSQARYNWNDTSLKSTPANPSDAMLKMDVITRIPEHYFISDNELQDKMKLYQDIVEISRSIFDPFTANFENNINLSLIDSDGCILSALNDGHIGAICTGFILINSNAAVKDSLLNGTAVNLYSPEANQNLICMPIMTNESVLCLGISNMSGKVPSHYLNIAQHIYQLLVNQYRLIMESSQLADALLELNYDPTIIVDEKGHITNANTSFLNFLDVNSKEILSGLPVNRILKNHNHLFDFNSVPDDPSFTIFCKNEWQPVELVGRRLLEIPAGCRQIALSFRRPKNYFKTVAPNLTGDIDPFSDIIGTNPIITKNIEVARKAAKIPTTVLIEGESGTGKELIAQGIHAASLRKGPFIAINCGAMSRELLQSELFGYADGAFTGAKKGGKPGKFLEADGGTIFLDEIGEMPEDMQVTLLRFLQDRMVTPIGDNRPHRVDVRVIAATNRNLKNEVQSGAFREDLYYRLNVINIKMPPLRERRDDIPVLAEHIIQDICSRYEIPAKNLSKKCLPDLIKHSWPGNVRELHNVLERAIVIADDELYINDLFLDELPAEEKLADVEKNTIITLLERNQGNITATAKALGIARTTLYRKLKGLGIETA